MDFGIFLCINMYIYLFEISILQNYSTEFLTVFCNIIRILQTSYIPPKKCGFDK